MRLPCRWLARLALCRCFRDDLMLIKALNFAMVPRLNFESKRNPTIT